MADLKPHDAAVIWMEDNDLHGTFHFSYRLGYSSLSQWRSERPHEEVIPDGAHRGRLMVLLKAFEGQCLNECLWCGRDEHNCLCDYLGDGIGWESNSEIF